MLKAVLLKNGKVDYIQSPFGPDIPNQDDEIIVRNENEIIDDSYEEPEIVVNGGDGDVYKRQHCYYKKKH